MRTRPIRSLVAFIAVASSPGAWAAEDQGLGAPRPPTFVLDAALSLGGGSAAAEQELLLGLGLQASLRRGGLVVGAGVDTATLIVGSGHTLLTVGAGGAFTAGSRRVVLQALVGSHWVNPDVLLGDAVVHRLAVAGARASLERDLRAGPLATVFLSLSVFADLERERDASSGAEVGGWTSFLAVGIGLGG